ncbi:MAG: cytidine deaminase [Candidatus Heimdallarchaeota archaeon]|nr:cytidine deaminase [Candidatus Heimdallarchaeota archaeon]
MSQQLFERAKYAMSLSYSPYSKFKVGCAVILKSGNIYIGTNIENSSYAATNCAERSAIFNAICADEREFVEMVVISSGEGIIKPCGICLQVMSEFFDENIKIHLYNATGKYHTFTLPDLLPIPFKFKI